MKDWEGWISSYADIVKKRENKLMVKLCWKFHAFSLSGLWENPNLYSSVVSKAGMKTVFTLHASGCFAARTRLLQTLVLLISWAVHTHLCVTLAKQISSFNALCIQTIVLQRETATRYTLVLACCGSSINGILLKSKGATLLACCLNNTTDFSLMTPD